jgi:hypothetical protein
LSGIGRLARLLGYKGFIIILDEMEKWHELNWVEQSRAGNLLQATSWADSFGEQPPTSRIEVETIILASWSIVSDAAVIHSQRNAGHMSESQLQ